MTGINVRLMMILACVFLLVKCIGPDRDVGGADDPAVAYDPVNNRYFAVYAKSHDEDGLRIYGRFVDATGGLPGNEFVLAQNVAGFECPAVAYDHVNGGFLVAWRTTDKSIIALHVNTDGSYRTARTVSQAADYISAPSVAYNGDQKEFLVLWIEGTGHGRIVYGRIIYADGSYSPKFPIAYSAGTDVSVAYDSINQRFLTVWVRSDRLSIQARFVNPDCTFLAPEFALYSASGYLVRPTIAYDNVNSRFLVAWEENGQHGYVLSGQVWNADGTMYNPVFAISSGTLKVSAHALMFDPAAQKYFALFADPTRKKVYGQTITAQGMPDTASSALLSYQDYPGDSEPSLAYDSVNQRYLSIWTYSSGYYQDIHGRIVTSDGTPWSPIFVISNGGEW